MERHARLLNLWTRCQCRVGATPADDGEHLVLIYKLFDRGDRPLWLAQVVLADQNQFAPVNAALLVELIEVDFYTVHGEFAVDINRAGQRPERAHLDFSIGDPRNIGGSRAEGSHGREGNGHANCACKLLHLEPPEFTKSASPMASVGEQPRSAVPAMWRSMA